MPERKWYKGRPIRRTRRMPGGYVKVIFDDGPKGQPGDATYVPEAEYNKRDENGVEVNVKREFCAGKSGQAEGEQNPVAQTTV